MITRRKALELAAFTPALAATGAIAGERPVDPVVPVYLEWIAALEARNRALMLDDGEGPESERTLNVQWDIQSKLAAMAPVSHVGSYCKLVVLLDLLAVKADKSFSSCKDKIDETCFVSLLKRERALAEAEGSTIPPMPTSYCGDVAVPAFFMESAHEQGWDAASGVR